MEDNRKSIQNKKTGLQSINDKDIFKSDKI